MYNLDRLRAVSGAHRGRYGVFIGKVQKEHPINQIGRVYLVFFQGKTMWARVCAFKWDEERRQTVYECVDASQPGEHMGLGERFTVPESAIGPERDAPYPGWRSKSPLTVDPQFIEVPKPGRTGR